jgi:hypothetical protein
MMTPIPSLISAPERSGPNTDLVAMLGNPGMRSVAEWSAWCRATATSSCEMYSTNWWRPAN